MESISPGLEKQNKTLPLSTKWLKTLFVGPNNNNTNTTTKNNNNNNNNDKNDKNDNNNNNHQQVKNKKQIQYFERHKEMFCLAPFATYIYPENDQRKVIEMSNVELSLENEITSVFCYPSG